ncbi:von Willebrand factor A domain-containing protein 7-like [Lethenteron reissneri]|uniref:von Willebrand factor A domain-containing protein 7-like n=1 Tax=Lethenteron reissneri TaxID=7753 RepID=UPI002AB66923|nr:von Willebrand factor A domain-containing protein 7-like [Lethenteron reissneri]
MTFAVPFALTLIFTLTLVHDPAAGFYPNQASLGTYRANHTDESVTETGALRAVAKFLEGKAGLAPGALEGLSPLTPTTLIEAYYQGNVSAVRFVKALQEVVDGNNFMEQAYPDITSYYANCEQFSDTRGELGKFRKISINYVNSSSPAQARKSLGQMLHILNKFYSNTNWIEQGNLIPLEALVNMDLPFPATASSTLATCTDCTTTSDPNVYECLNNIILASPLTSGYRPGRRCRTKPATGKCSHGGINDAWQNQTATGGINKETLEPELSPHHYHHDEAGQVAMIATRDVLVNSASSVLEELGEKVFMQLFNLERHSLVYVVDVTGSMSNDIALVRDKTKEMVLKVANKTEAPETYVLVTFSDPDVYEPLITKDWTEMYQALDSLQVGGGGDCPEMALTALELALQISQPGSDIYLFTDAGAKDEEEKKDAVMALFESTDSRLHVFNTGSYCTRGTQGELSSRASEPRQNIYETLTALSGGQYILTTKGELAGVLGSLELSLNAAPVSVRYVEVTTPDSVTFPVDSSLSEIAVSVSGPASFTVELFLPSGELATDVEELVSSSQNVVRRVTSVTQGTWTVKVTGSPGPHLVKVTGRSLVDFTAQLLQRTNGFMLPIPGRPITGEPYQLWVKPMGSVAGYSMSSVRLLSGMGNLEYLVSPTESEFGVPLQFIDSMAFMVEVCGSSPEGLQFCRMHTQLTTVQSFRLAQLNFEEATLQPGVEVSLSVVLENRGVAASSFSVSARDELGWASAVSPSSAVLAPGETAKLNVTVAAPQSITEFTSSMLRVTAESVESPDSSYTLSFPLSVFIAPMEIPDTSPPAVLELARDVSACTAEVQHGGEALCSGSSWSVDVEAIDAETEEPLTVNIALGDRKALLTVSSIDGVYKINYRSPCCSPWVTLDVSDFTGNLGRYSLDFAEPMPTQDTTAEGGRTVMVIALSVVSVVLVVILIALGVVIGRYCCRSKRAVQQDATPSIITNPWAKPMQRPDMK